MSVTVNYDNSNIKYTGNWFPFTPGDGSGMTLYGTVATGSTASLVFTGTSVGVYGTIYAGNTNPQSTYSIDGTVLASYTEPLSNYTEYNHLLWQSQTLSNGVHTIVVTYHSGIGFWLDYMQYTTQAASPSPSPNPVSTSAAPEVVNSSPTQQSTPTTGSSSPLTTVAQASDSPSLTPSSSRANSSITIQSLTSLSQATSSPTFASSQSSSTPAASSSNKNLIGPIVGGVVGGLLLLFLLVCFGLRRMRRSREETVLQSTAPIMRNHGPNSVTPFTSISSPNLQGAGMSTSQYARQDDLGYTVHGSTTLEKVGLRNAPPSQSDSYGSSSMDTRSRGVTEPSQSSQFHLMALAHDQESAYGAYTEAPPEYGDIRT